MLTLDSLINKYRELVNEENITEEEKEERLFIGESLVELKVFKRMYADDIRRFDEYYKTLDDVADKLLENCNTDMEDDKNIK